MKTLVKFGNLEKYEGNKILRTHFYLVEVYFFKVFLFKRGYLLINFPNFTSDFDLEC